MEVKLLRPARIRHEAGEVVKVSPAEYSFLVSIGSAIPMEEKVEDKSEAKKTTKKK